MLVAGIVFALMGISLFPQKEVSGGIIFLLISALLLFLWYRKKKKFESVSSEKMPDTYKGQAIAYQNREILLFIPEQLRKNLPRIKAGTELEISQEPQNTYDNRAIKFSYRGKTVGYAYRNGTQDMLNDWFEHGDPVIAKFLYYPCKENACINLAFYRNKKQVAECPKVHMGEVLAYHYENIKLYTPPQYVNGRPQVSPGTELEVMPEPENPYDNRAVKFSYNGKTIGYVNRGRLQDMFNDWFTYGHPFIVRFLEYDSPESVAVNIAFYRGKDKKQSVPAEEE